MAQLYSQRNRGRDVYRYDVPPDVRSRILHCLSQLSDDIGTRFDFEQMLENVGDELLKKYGRMKRSAFNGARRSDHPVVEHFFCVKDEMALDFIEMCFLNWMNSPDQAGVDSINEIFQDASIGYELSKCQMVRTGKRGRFAGEVAEYKQPRIIRKDNQSVHEDTVKPSLDALANPIFSTANSEILAAHEKYREGKYEDCITSCGSAFESVLKTVCEQLGWGFNADKDTCSKLVGVCKDNGLFPPFYAPIFEAVGTIRNKLGDAHGRGPTPLYSVKKEHADHMIHIVSAHILLVIRLADLEQ